MHAATPANSHAGLEILYVTHLCLFAEASAALLASDWNATPEPAAFFFFERNKAVLVAGDLIFIAQLK